MFRVLVDHLKLFPGKDKADRCFPLTVKLFAHQPGGENEIAGFAPDAEDLSDHCQHKPACGSGEIVVHSAPVRAEILRDPRIDPACIKVQRSFGKRLQRFPAFFCKAAAVQGVGIHHGHM